MYVPLYDFKRHVGVLEKEIVSSIHSVMERQDFIMGQEVKELEKKIAKYTGSSFAFGVSSGTDALLLSLMSLGIGSEDEVITTPFSFFSTASVIARLGAKPVFVDIEKENLNLNSSKIPQLMNQKVKAIIPVHIYGRMAKLDDLIKLQSDFEFSIVEDVAQALGAKNTLGMAGSVGDIGCFSFYPTKNLGAFGDAGMITTSRDDLANRIASLRTHGSLNGTSYDSIGGNFRLDTIQAAVLLVKLKKIDEWNRERLKIAENYNKFIEELAIQEFVRLPNILEESHVFHQYVVRVKHRKELRKFLHAENVSTGIYYTEPLHLQPCFKYLDYKKGDFPECELACSEVLSLPIFPGLKVEEQSYVVGKIEEFYRKRK